MASFSKLKKSEITKVFGKGITKKYLKDVWRHFKGKYPAEFGRNQKNNKKALKQILIGMDAEIKEAIEAQAHHTQEQAAKTAKAYKERRIKSDGKRAHKELTYKRLAELLEIEYKPSHMAISLNDALKFFQKTGHGLSVYDVNMNLIHRENPKDEYHSVLYLVKHENHVYTINDNIDSLKNKKTAKIEDEKLELPATTDYIMKDPDTVEITKWIEKMEDMTPILTSFVAQPEKKTVIKFVCNDARDILAEVINKGLLIPNVKFDKSLLGFNFSVNQDGHRIPCSVQCNDQSGDSKHDLRDEKEYKQFNEVVNKFSSKIIADDLKSYYHPSVLEIEDFYNIGPINCKFVEKMPLGNKLNDIDCSKAYSTCVAMIDKIPVSEYWDVYQKYDGHEIEDWTMYLVKSNATDTAEQMILHSAYCRCYGYALKCLEQDEMMIDGPYEILYFRRADRIVDVDFSKDVADVYNSVICEDDEHHNMDLQKFAVNKTVGLCSKKYNIRSKTMILDNKEDAHAYELMYNGSMLPFVLSRTEEGNEMRYIVNISTEVELMNGFRSIREMIYTIQNVRLYHMYKKLESLKVKPLCIHTDAILFEDTEYNNQTVKDHFKMTKKVGGFNFETDKVLVGKLFKVEENTLMDIKDLTVPEQVSFKEEANWEDKKMNKIFQQKVNEYISNHDHVMIIAPKIPGAGKSQCCKNYDKNPIVVAPYNVLCQKIGTEGFEAITLNKLLGVDPQGHCMACVDVSEYKTIIFDEILLHNPSMLMRIARFVSHHEKIKVLATGDLSQVEPIGFHGKSDVLERIINIMFPHQILLHHNKRMIKKEHREMLNDLYDDIFNSTPDNVFDMLVNKYHFKYIEKIADLKTTTNLCFYNERRAHIVNNHVHRNILKHDTDWVVGNRVMVAKYRQGKKNVPKLNTNYTFMLDKIEDKKYYLTDVVNETKICIDEETMNKHFKHPYCFTIDSVQGTSIDTPYTIFDIGSPYLSKKHLWTMLTRCRDFDNVTLFQTLERRG